MVKFDTKGVKQGQPLDKFKSEWINAMVHENGIILGEGENCISTAQLFVINMFCGHDVAYGGTDMILSTNGPAQSELEALFRARGRALAQLFQRESS